MALELLINGVDRSAVVETRITLLEALRNTFLLPGSNKGRDQGACGACTVIVDVQRVLSCLALGVRCAGRDVRTTEGLSQNGRFHPVPGGISRVRCASVRLLHTGQILSTVCLLDEASWCPQPRDA
jgi:xanthine dehydrogenase YagT iron-sulfur-binding subunit